MYTHLLDAAVGQRTTVSEHPTERAALDAVRRCRRALGEEPAAADPDAVPAVLARELGYDVALLDLAEALGIETGPSRFEQPRHERARLERAFRERGIALHSQPSADQATSARD
jgi:hypothetical protein